MAVANCVFAWGAGECYFFESQKVWRSKWSVPLYQLGLAAILTISRSALPAGVNKYFNCDDKWKISHVHTLVFGANGSYLMTWRAKDGKNYESTCDFFTD